MTMAFECIAELDLGPAASAVVTAEFYRELFNEAVAAGEFVVLLSDEIASDSKCPPMSKRVDFKRGISSDELAKLGKQAQSGYRMAVVLSNAERGLRVLESRGYERCTITSPGSAAAIRGWTAWMSQYVPEVQGALVFGHDYEPAFIFEKIEKK